VICTNTITSSSSSGPPTLLNSLENNSNESSSLSYEEEDEIIIKSRGNVNSDSDYDDYLLASSDYSEDVLGDIPEPFLKDHAVRVVTPPHRVDTPTPWIKEKDVLKFEVENIEPFERFPGFANVSKVTADELRNTMTDKVDEPNINESLSSNQLDILDTLPAPVANDAVSETMSSLSDDLPSTSRSELNERVSSQAEFIMLSPMASRRDDINDFGNISNNPLAILRRNITPTSSSVIGENKDIDRQDGRSDVSNSNPQPLEIDSITDPIKLIVACDSGVKIDTNKAGRINLSFDTKMIKDSISDGDLDNSLDISDGPFTYKGKSYIVNARLPLTKHDNHYVIENFQGTYPEGSEGEISLTHFDKDDPSSSTTPPRYLGRLSTDNIVPISDTTGKWYDVSYLFETGMNLLSRARNAANPCEENIEDGDDSPSATDIDNGDAYTGENSADSIENMKINQIREKETTSGSKGFWSTYSYQTSFGTNSNDDSWPLILPAPVGDTVD